MLTDAEADEVDAALLQEAVAVNSFFHRPRREVVPCDPSHSVLSSGLGS